ncbi:MAG TPA: hypothetical protein VD788_12090, partial [Candidatus Polarisedimenticolaceae bacterium]|nr:hypothetical protein [Candidatus Polarisedimenticolaceae bacterium]
MFPAVRAWSIALLLAAPPSAQDRPREPEPLEVEVDERATVRLVLVDTVVVDSAGRTVPDLTIDDFEVFALGRPVEVDTLDVDCPVGAVDDPAPMRLAAKRPSLPATEQPRRIVLAFDYLHLGALEREEAIDQAQHLLKNGAARGDEVMVAALNGGLRIEQTFTADAETAFLSLRRMQYDVTLWNGNFEHINEYGFVEGLTGLFDVLGTVPGPKAVV